MRRSLLLLGIFGAGLVSIWYLRLSLPELIPNADRWGMLWQFLAAAFSPAIYSQSDLGLSLLPRVLVATWNTVVFATAALSLSLVAGVVLGVFASESWWRLFPGIGWARPLVYGATRACIALMRSIHEVLWAVALLAAFGLNTVAAVIAISIPYAGTLAKVFSEMLDEAPEDTSEALRLAGAGPLQVFFFGLLPGALPDLGAYTFYRFECALRSSAILGFFGFPTLGKFIYESVGQLYFHEAWTYLYALIALIVLVEWWSGALRQELTIA